MRMREWRGTGSFVGASARNGYEVRCWRHSMHQGGARGSGYVCGPAKNLAIRDGQADRHGARMRQIGGVGVDEGSEGDIYAPLHATALRHLTPQR